MSLIGVTNLTFNYPGTFENIFDDATFSIDTNWKLGFIGRNGRGKTTFLKLLLGEYSFKGRITASVSFDYFPFTVKNPTAVTLTVLEEIVPGLQPWELERELRLLDVDPALLQRPYHSLSGGEQVKVQLAALFLKEHSFLLIDEPTNHLDSDGRRIVSAYLNRKQGFILVSHDRAFLDGCVDHILSINRANIEVQQGNFSSWWQNKQYRDQFEQAQNQRLEQEVAHLKESAQRTASWSDKIEKTKRGSRNSGLRPDKGYIGHKSAKMMKRSKATAQRRQQSLVEKSKLLKNLEVTEKLAISPLKHHAAQLVEIRDLVVNYGTGPVCGPLTFSIKTGDKVALQGKNGSGKSSVLKLILNESIPYTGTLHTASGLVVSYLSQSTQGLCGNLADYALARKIDESLFKAILRKLDFSRLHFAKDINSFSAGQKKKVLIAASLCERAHLYVWDEPLNFIDVYSRIQIEQLLTQYAPTLLFVEHDSAFVKGIANQFIKL